MHERGLGAMVFGVLCSLVVGLLFVAAPAVAAAPETPTLTVEEPVHATSATFLGVLNPTAPVPSEGGTYKFLYKAGTGTECEGGSETSSGLSFGNAPEPLSPETVTGLVPNTEYAVCLSVTNLESPSRTAVSLPVAFKTTVPPEKPQTSEPAVSITATSAKLEGVLNPHSTTKVGGYFAYSNPGGSSCMEGPTVGLEEFGGEEEAEAIAVHATVGLEEDRTYRFCLVASNEFGNATVGNEVVVETLAPPPAILSENAPALVGPVAGSVQARLTATVNPNNQATECHFQYGVASVSENEVPCEQASLTGFEQGVGATVSGLVPERVYHYRVVLKNAAGEEAKGAEQQFETLFSPAVLETGDAEEVTAATATLGGRLDAGGEAEYYVEYGTAACSASSCGTKSQQAHASGRIQECTLGGALHECVTPIAVSGLEPNTTYHYWLAATNAAVSEPVHGEAKQFTTSVAAPSVHTGVAQRVTSTSAQLAGELNPGGGEAEYYVEYLLPSNTTARSATAFASGKTQVSVGPIAVGGLEPNTTYYYWLVAKSSAVSAPVRGQAHQFTTAKSQAEVEAQEAASPKPGQEPGTVGTVNQKLEEEARARTEEAAAANAAKQRQYDEIALVTAGLERREAEASKPPATAQKPKAKPRQCHKDFIRRKNKCVAKKSKKGKVKK